MKQNKLALLFPTAVMTADIDTIPQQDHDYLLDCDYHQDEQSTGGQFQQTTDTYVLDHGAATLKSWIELQLAIFGLEVMATDTPLRITQSWCLKHQHCAQRLYQHCHPNSVVSGAYYVQASETSQRLRFHRNDPAAQRIRWDQNSQLMAEKSWCWDYQEIEVATGRLILFPSHLEHSVPQGPETDDLRCVLSFNTWFAGPFGDPARLFELR